MRNIEPLILLFHNRWNIVILDEMQRTSGSKFVTLVKRLGMSKDSLRRTLAALIDAGWVVRNPGYGHPLRPEYILTPDGSDLARSCVRFVNLLSTLGVKEVALRKWSMPVVFALYGGSTRFLELKLLLGITSRALTLALKDLEPAGIINRTLINTQSSWARYQLSERGCHLALLLEGLADALPGRRST